MNLVSQIAKLLITMEYYITVSQQERDVERRYKRENPINDLTLYVLPIVSKY